jgi:SET domain-containing protein
LRALRDFQPNSFILEYRGEVISTEECEHRMVTMYTGRSNYYFLNIDADTILDAGRKGSEARFANHCCAPVFPPSFCPNTRMRESKNGWSRENLESASLQGNVGSKPETR